MNLKRLLSAILFLSFALAEGVALSQEGFLETSREASTLEYERVLTSEQLKRKISWAILPYLKDIRYDVHITINLKSKREKNLESDRFEREQRAKQDQSTVDLGKLGTAAAPIKEELITTLNLQQNISTIKIMLVFYDYVPEDKVDIIKTLSKKLVDIVPVWRLRVETLVPPPPAKPTKTEWLEEHKWQIASIILGALLLALTFVMGFRVRRASLAEDDFDTVSHPGHTHTYPHSDYQPSHAKTASDEPPAAKSSRVTWMNQDTVIEVTPRDADREADSTADQETVLEASPEVEVRESVAEEPMRSSRAGDKSELLRKIQTATFEEESQIYRQLFSRKNGTLAKELASEYFPAELMERLSPGILKQALQSLPLEKRMSLMAGVPESLRLALLETTGPRGTKARDFAEMEIAQARRDNGDSWKAFKTEVRNLISSSGDYKKEADELIRHWLIEKSHRAGKNGSHAA